MTESNPIAFVLPWYRPDAPHGAETNAGQMARHLTGMGVKAEVWTTCAQSLGTDWSENYHKSGRSTVNGVPVERFPVLAINRDRWGAIYQRLAHGGRVTVESEIGKGSVFSIHLPSR